MSHHGHRNIIGYVETLPSAKRDSLYESPWTCQAMLRSLSPLAKQYVVRLLWVALPVAKDDVDDWVRDKRQYGGQHRAAVSALKHLGLFQEVATSDGKKSAFRLHPTFQAQLRASLATGGQGTQELPPRVLEACPHSSVLDKFAHQQWEALQLYILTSSSDAPSLPHDAPRDAEPLDVHRLLVTAGLLHGSRTQRAITDQGFQFLLRDNYHQLWAFLTEYIKDAEQRSGAELTSVVSFLMQLGFKRVGAPYPLAALSPMERAIAAHMMQLGLLLPFNVAREAYFCPTRLAASLCGGFSGASSSINADIAGGHIIVETNYRVYAYTTSPVQVAILELFCRNDCVLPNLFVGTLTRDSVFKAIKSGICAEEIVAYLQAHAHPNVANRVPVVPEVVSDQVRLWEAETLRVRAAACMLYDQFETPELYAAAAEYAANLGVQLWCNPVKRVFAAKEESHEQIKNFIRQLKQQAAGLA